MSDMVPAEGQMPPVEGFPPVTDVLASEVPSSPEIGGLTTDEKIDFLIQSQTVVNQQVAWLCHQLYQAMEAINSNPMLRKVMGR